MRGSKTSFSLKTATYTEDLLTWIRSARARPVAGFSSFDECPLLAVSRPFGAHEIAYSATSALLRKADIHDLVPKISRKSYSMLGECLNNSKF